MSAGAGENLGKCIAKLKIRRRQHCTWFSADSFENQSISGEESATETQTLNGSMP